MKKAYEAPTIEWELFTVSDIIAVSQITDWIPDTDYDDTLDD